MQVLNVAMGGTLVQDIPSQVTGALEHSVPRAALRTSRTKCGSSKGSQLSTLLADHMEDGETCHVNSRHHQSVKQAAEGFDVTATSPDGVIEAMEKAGRAVLRRGAVASGEFLADRRVPRAVRRPRAGG